MIQGEFLGGESSRLFITARNSASPSAAIAVVVALGAKPERAGFLDLSHLQHDVGNLAQRAGIDVEVMAMTGFPTCLTTLSIRRISSLSPL